jgi:hypothetical protein
LRPARHGANSVVRSSPREASRHRRKARPTDPGRATHAGSCVIRPASYAVRPARRAAESARRAQQIRGEWLAPRGEWHTPQGERLKIRRGRSIPHPRRTMPGSTILPIRPYTRTPRDACSEIHPKRPTLLFDN